VENINWIERDIIESKAKGQTIITRYPPEPNGYMHIGHAKAFSLDYFLAKKHGGTTTLRFEDTNPTKESMEYVDAMQKDIKWLGMDWSHVVFISDNFEKIYNLACEFIKKELAYVDFQTPEQLSETRGTLTSPGKNSPYRDTAPAENLKLFADMKDGKFKPGECVLRAKIDMASPNLKMRDPLMYRILDAHHMKTGTPWCIYPLYDYAHAMSDMLGNISHSICSLEYDDHRALYDWFISQVFTGKVPPRQFEFSRLNIEQTVMSKRYLKRFVDEKVVDGWDDPRMPTISGMRRRGYPPQSIIDFVQSTSVSRTPMTVPLSALEFYVRDALDPVANRVSVVFNPIKVIITNYNGAKPEKLIINSNPKDENAGSHEMYFGKEIYINGEDFSINPPKGYKRLASGGTVRLRGAYIIKCEKVITAKNGAVSHLECSYYPDSKSGSDTSGIKPNGVIHFVEATTAKELTINEFVPLLHKGTSLDEENINTESKTTFKALAEPFIEKAVETVQFVRKGFYKRDEKLSKGKELVYIKTVGLKEGF